MLLELQQAPICYSSNEGGAKLKDLSVINSSHIADFFEAAANGIQDRGKANLGDKTMLDVWLPTAEKIKETQTIQMILSKF